MTRHHHLAFAAWRTTLDNTLFAIRDCSIDDLAVTRLELATLFLCGVTPVQAALQLLAVPTTDELEHATPLEDFAFAAAD